MRIFNEVQFGRKVEKLDIHVINTFNESFNENSNEIHQKNGIASRNSRLD
jgi:hypothetical protein